MSDEICYYVSSLCLTFHILSLCVSAMAPHETTVLGMMSECVGEQVWVIVIVCVLFCLYFWLWDVGRKFVWCWGGYPIA